MKFCFGDQPHPTVAHSYGEYQSNKRTNAFNKSDKEACEWAFHERALGSGGDAVIDIKVYYKKIPFSSPTEFHFGVGNTVAGVTLIGTVAKLGEAAKPAAGPSSAGKPAATTPAAATHASSGTDTYTELIKLDELRKKGILTE